MINNEKLKTSLIGGYNKKMVLELIERIDAGATEKMNSLSASLKEKFKEIEALKAEIQNLTEDGLRKDETIHALECSLKEKNVEVRDKRSYEEISKTIGDVLVNVQSTCQKIIAESKQEVENISQNTEKKATLISSSIENSKLNFAASKEQMQIYISAFETSLAQIMTEFEQIERDFKTGKHISDKTFVFDKCKQDAENSIHEVMERTRNSPATN